MRIIAAAAARVGVRQRGAGRALRAGRAARAGRPGGAAGACGAGRALRTGRAAARLPGPSARRAGRAVAGRRERHDAAARRPDALTATTRTW